MVASCISLTGYEIVLLRSLLDSIMLIAVFFLTGHRLTVLRHKRDLLYIALSGIAMASVQTVAVCGYLEPLSAVVLAVIFLREEMQPLQILAAVLIIGGAIFGECFHRRKID